MTTPRITRLLRVPDLQGMQQAIAECLDGPSPTTAVLVPTAAAGDALRRTLADRGVNASRCDIQTRDDLYARLHAHLPGAPPMLSAFEREVLLTRAAQSARDGGAAPPFKLRPGLIAEILAFYDELMRRDRTIAQFDRLMTDALHGSVDIDRGAERLYRQTLFLTAAFTEFDALVGASGGVDEHSLRRLLLEQSADGPYARVIVTVADQAADPRGLWTADFDLLARLHGVEALDVIATENVLAAGFHQRVHDLLPGIDEVRAIAPAPPPVLTTPAGKPGEPAPRWFTSRDREEELGDVARTMGVGDAPERNAVIFQRPLPYLYLARPVFASARIPYQTLDTLPLAAEPFAAALDIVFAFILAEANRASTIELLASPHWQFPELTGDAPSIRARIDALDVLLREQKYLGGWDRLDALAASIRTDRTDPAVDKNRRSRRADPSDAIAAAINAGRALAPVRTAATAPEQIRTLLAFMRDRVRGGDSEAPWSSRQRRTRAAVIDALERLASAHDRYDRAALPIERLAGAVRRWIGGQTFAPSTGERGIRLLDAPAAPYADLDEVRLVGLVESDWPERVRRSIFYPSGLLSQLGWPNETDRLAAARARFQDLLRLPRVRVSASTFTLEDDAIVSGSPFLEEIETSGLVAEQVPLARTQLFVHEQLFGDAADSSRFTDRANAWLALRASRTPADHESFHGAAGPRPPAAYAVSHVERYLECPFKYFATRVLQLDEERDDESGLSPQERGQLLHTVFEVFFTEWHARGGREITAANLSAALELFAAVAEATLSHLPEGDRALERTYLLGSAAAPGLAERAFNFEIEHGVPVIERLLEHPLEGEFEFRGADGRRRLRIRAKADRIDLLNDGTLRVIDYKLSRAPKPTRALQLPVYGVCAEQSLAGRHGRSWKVARAGYVAFKEKNAFVTIGGGSTSLEEAFEEGERRLVAAADGIERGEFPVRPDEPYRCRWCGYAGICRKDYVGDE
ncbi:MAG TPA: PD-(D/E)XK nuclease family protein [Vicinamibacterales bacterium]|nr:PD-(D/E)XK nuclease family protein [Vicinamibacterales bacterium]